MVMTIVRCMAGLSIETLQAVKVKLVEERDEDSELSEAIDRFITMTEEEIAYLQGGGEN